MTIMTDKNTSHVKVSNKRKVKEQENASSSTESARETLTADGPLSGAEPEGGTRPRSAPGAGEGQDPYLDDLRRLQADFENYRKRMMREQTSVADRATAAFVTRLLPVLDSFERALSHGDSGLGAVHKSLMEILHSEGLEEISALGKPFDPTVHEAVESRDDDDVNEAVCAEVYRAGYRFKGSVLRPAMVVVARPRERPSPSGSDDSVSEETEAAEG